MINPVLDKDRDWRSYLTSDEADNMEYWEARAARLDAERKRTSDQISRVRNRCMQRRRFKIGNLPPEEQK